MHNVLKYIRENLDLVLPLILLIPFYLIIYKLYIPHLTAFGCFDDCFNFLGGYFMAHGKFIYHDFFFNHQPLPAFLSFLIQFTTHPENIYELVLRHRQFIMLWSFLFSILLVIKFRLPAFLFIVVFELSKFYIFGDRFLAEPLIVYPTVYLAGLALLKTKNQQPRTIDYLAASLLSWFVIFSREPYVPLAIFLTIVIFWGKFNKTKYISAIIFGVLTLLTFALFKFNISQYWFNIVIFNYKAVLPADIVAGLWGPKVLQIFFYPIYIPFYGDWSLFKIVLTSIDVVFLILFTYLLKHKKYKETIFIFITLGLANLRVVVPGSIFYAAFHFIIYFALLSFTTVYLVFENRKSKALFAISLIIILSSLIYLLSQKSYFGYDKIDRQADFHKNFSTLLQEGAVINALSKPDQAFFIDGSDDLIYWQADRMSRYKYVWYTSQMPEFDKYRKERLSMFKNNPPEFYREFGSCPKKVPVAASFRLPNFVAKDYVRLYNLSNPSCLFIRKDVVGQITDTQWAKAKDFLYTNKSK